MSPNAFLESLWRAGLTLRVEGDQLHVSPRNLLTDGQRDFIRANKAELIRLVLASHWDDVDFSALEPDWDAGPVQLVEGVAVNLWGQSVAISQELADLIFRPPSEVRPKKKKAKARKKKEKGL
jgi:hypothetical protein